ncbi:MAG: hypothetical protein ACYDDF_09650 [Thermoplasmatota archaeon]
MTIRPERDAWMARNARILETAFRMTVGLVWGIDAAFKFQPNFERAMLGIVAKSSQGQPPALPPWFSFWSGLIGSEPSAFAWMIALVEATIAFAVVLGILRRRPAYIGRMDLNLSILEIPEGFGGPYGPGSTDVGVGIVYAPLFGSLLLLQNIPGQSECSLDRRLAEWWALWARFA